MRKNILSNFLIFLIIFLISVSCEEMPEAKFTATKLEKDGKVYVTFFDESGNDPDDWEWTFQGGTPNTSNEQNPTIEYNKEGKYDVKLVASNKGGADEFFKNEWVTVFRFSNSMQTDAEVRLLGETIPMAANSSCLLASFNNSAYSCHVETSGKTHTGEQLGYLIYWDFYLNFDYYANFIFGISDDLVFFNITNNSISDYNYFMVNRGTEYESLEQFLIPNDGKKYGTGYYAAFDGMEVRAYSEEEYVTWKEGNSFNIPWEDNQAVNLSSDLTEDYQKSIIIDTTHPLEKENINSQLGEGSIIITESGYINFF